jgi:hypothetical protein
VAWAQATGEGSTRGKIRGAAASLAPAGFAVAPTAEESRTWRLPRGKSEILWACGRFLGCWQAHLAGRPQLRRVAPASWPAGDGIWQWEERGGRR